MLDVGKISFSLLLEDRPHPGTDLDFVLVADIDEVLESVVSAVEPDESVSVRNGLGMPGLRIHEMETENGIGDKGSPGPDLDQFVHLLVAGAANLPGRDIDLPALRATDPQELLVVAQFHEELAAVTPHSVVEGLFLFARLHHEKFLLFA
jgi:hypothetical protein